ncbi:hypothetical protein ABW21_db0205945 [Orbilia brochopaga]|nr:hypothetical protein ABW21_db0205945 [Drechslerella brochopaga]
MAPIYSIPPELIAAVCGDLSQDDIVHLRQTCKALSALAFDPHMKLVYRSWSIYLMPSSLTRLVNILRHNSRIGRFILHLRINPSLPSISPREFAKPAISSNPAFRQYSFNRDPDRDVRLLKEKMVKDHNGNIQDIGTYPDLGAHLQFALASMPNLRRVELVTDQQTMTRYEFNQCYPSARVTLAEWPKTQTLLKRLLLTLCQTPSPHNYWAHFLRGATSSTVSSTLQTLTMNGHVGILTRWLGDTADKELNDGESLFPQLKTLIFRPSHVYEQMQPQKGDLTAREHLVKFLAIIGRNVETLIMTFPRRRPGTLLDQDRTPLGRDVPNRVSAFPAITTFPRLKHLHLQDARLDVDNLMETLDRCPRIETYKILYCRIPETETSVFRLLRHMRRQDPPTVKNLRLFWGRNADGIPSMAVKSDEPWAGPFNPTDLWVDCRAITPQAIQEDSIWNPSSLAYVQIAYKHLASDLDRLKDHMVFWAWMSNGTWTRDNRTGMHEDLTNYLFWKEDARANEGSTNCATICGKCTGCGENSWTHGSM